ncbi:hypothetical protein AMECASPLE_036765 [Ameca splendens]|uniref:Uncharacterized protein n=1 Tax=Ameca splendens TaxID=208324 RepID=A0ABV0ZTV2_9TELE
MGVFKPSRKASAATLREESKNVRHCIEQACTGAQGMAEGPSFWICSCTNKKSRWNHESHELGMCYSWEKRDSMGRRFVQTADVVQGRLSFITSKM